MKHFYTLLGALALGTAASAQCIAISCVGALSTTNDPNMCGAVVNYSAPTIASYTCSGGAASDTFNYTGAQQTFVVPPGVTSVTIETWGAQGGANWVNNTNFGGYVAADVAVTPGSTLYIYVGGQATTTIGGFNGGGNGEGAGKGGGGGTDVRIGGTTYNDRVVVAGGGGGAGYWSNLHVVGGQGGGLTGGDGYRDPSYASNPGGLGGTQSAGGANGTCVSFNVVACAGGFGYGGSITGCGCEVYGGGGGWYGGAASGNCRGGGGGSGYAIPTSTNVVMNTGVRAGNGRVVISYSVAGNPVITQIAGLPSGSNFPVGVTTNTFVADDGIGNTDTCSFTVTVTDTTSPNVYSLPANIAVNNDSGMCSAVVSWSPVYASDNCTIQSFTSTHNSGDTFPVGTTWVTYTAVDAAGLVDTAGFSVTVTDNELPMISCPANVTVNTDPGQCTASNVNLGTETATDNCSVTTSNDAPATYPLGVTTVTYTATDASGNTASCIMTVTVVDAQAPSYMNCPLDITMCPGVVQFSSPMAMDNCGASSVQVSGPTSGSTLTAGNYTVVFVATDSAGNADTCSFNITVNANPIIQVSFQQTACVSDGNVTLLATPAGGTWSGTGVTGNTFSPSVAGAGQHILTYTYVDSTGCMASGADTITVSPCVGINEIGAQTFTLFPNPASTTFTFQCNEEGTVELMDASGKVVSARNVVSSQTEIDVTGFASGMYVVRFTSTSGTISTAQLQIQR